MASYKRILFSDFIQERKVKYDPNDPSIAKLKKIEKIDFSHGQIHLGQYKPTKTKQIIVEPGDFVFSGLNIEKGAVSINQTNERLVVSANYSTCEVDYSVIDRSYFSYFMRSAIFRSLLIDNLKKGYGFTRPKHLMGLSIIVPSEIKDQRRVADLYRQQKNVGQDLKSELTQQQSLLKKLRQQILQEAIEGKLTADWRQQNPDVEPASELLKRIREEKEQLIQDKKIRKQKPLPAITADEIPFDIPEGWEWCRLADISINLDSARKPVSKAERLRRKKIYPYYGASGAIDKIDGFTHDGTFLLVGEDGSNLRLRSTPIAYVVSGKIWVNNHAHVIHFLSSLTQTFVEHRINSMDISPYVTGGFQPKLSQRNLSSIAIPFPSLAEQKAIVAKVEHLLALCDQLEARVASNLAHAEQLMQSVLKEAFASS